jgi:hypothetical protein
LAKGYVHWVTVVCGSEAIATHQRSYERETADWRIHMGKLPPDDD